jgi:hypothetical protein
MPANDTSILQSYSTLFSKKATCPERVFKRVNLFQFPPVGALPYAKAMGTLPKEYWELAKIWPKSTSAEMEIPLE